MKSDGDAILRVIDGREIRLGTQAEFAQAAREITGYTGGSSWGGALSYLWGFLYGDMSPLGPDRAERIAKEAADFQTKCGAGLSEGANALLHRLASLVATDQKPE